MGRRPTVNLHMPPGLRARKRGDLTFYYLDVGGKPRKEIPLGKDYSAAVRQWAELTETPHPAKARRYTVSWAIEQYVGSTQFKDIAPGSQKDYQYAFDKLNAAFGDAPLDEVKPSHVTLYVDKRSEQSKHRAIREKSVLSMLFTWCAARDYCMSNPVTHVKTKRLPGRKQVYITDEMLDAVYEQAPQDLKDAIDLAYYIGQRPGDLLSLTDANIKDGHLEYRQQKTGKAQRVKIAGALDALLSRIKARKAGYAVTPQHLLVNEKGKRLTRAMLRIRFEIARSAAGIPSHAFQFRDLRRKSGSDLRDQVGLAAAQTLLGHTNQAMTEHYTAGRGGLVADVPRARG